VIVEYVRYRIPSDHAAAFLADYARATDVLDADEHCLNWEISRGHEEPDNWVVRITWDSLAGHEQGFRQAPHFADFFTAVRRYFPAIQEMKHYDVQHASAP
jgi:quinol monooxygenase YgiN